MFAETPYKTKKDMWLNFADSTSVLHFTVTFSPPKKTMGIRACTMSKLLEKLMPTYRQDRDLHLITEFLTVYRLVMQPQELLSAIITRYNGPYDPTGYDPDRFQQTVNAIRYR
jgi:hypothetical protein